MTKPNLPKAYDWSTQLGDLNGVSDAPIWFSLLPSGLAVQVWENLDPGPRFTANIFKPTSNFDFGNLFADIDDSFDPVSMTFDSDNTRLTDLLTIYA